MSTATVEDTRKLADRRLAAAKEKIVLGCPQWAPIAWSLRDFPTTQVPKMAVSAKWVLAYNRDWVAEAPLGEIVCIIVHESLHLWLKHHDRAARLDIQYETVEWEIANIAMDCVIYPFLVEDGLEVPAWHCKPEDYGLANNLAFEVYFEELLRRHHEEKGRDEEQPPQESGGDDPSPGDGEPSDDGESSDEGEPSEDGDAGKDGQEDDSEASDDSSTEGDGEGNSGDEQDAQEGSKGDEVGDREGIGGSCADGIPRDWEPVDEETGEYETPIEEYEQQQVLEEVDQKIEKLCEAGRMGGSSAREVAAARNPCRVDPRKVFMATVRQSVNRIRGYSERTYRKPARRQSPGGFLKPSRYAVVPRITIAVDTSGSMNGGDIRLAVELVRKTCSSFKLGGIRIVAGDIRISMDEYVRNPDGIDWRGGGGTEMGVMIEQIIETSTKANMPHLIVVVTDGGTDWCEKPPVPVVIALTSRRYVDHPSLGDRYQTPAWAKTICLDD